MVEHFPAVSFGPVGIAVQEDGKVIIVRDNTSEMSDDAVKAAEMKAERSALGMGFVKRSIIPDVETILMSIWELEQAGEWVS